MIFGYRKYTGYYVRPILVLPKLFRTPRTMTQRISKAFLSIGPLYIIWIITLWITCAFGIWQSSLVYTYASKVFTDGMTFDHDRFLWNVFIGSWIRWDSIHYQDIATRGYLFHDEQWPNIAFFPLYPLLVKALSFITNINSEVSAIAVSQFAMLVALLFLYDLVSSEISHTIARRSVILLLTFPTSFFFIAGYSESLALVLAVIVLWAIRKQKWWLAGIVGFALTLTRLPGVFITPVLLVEYLTHHKWDWKKLKHRSAISIFLPPLGIILFMSYQWWRFGTPFAFIAAQQSWEGNRISPPWIIPIALMYRYYSALDWPLTTFYVITWIGCIFLIVVTFKRISLTYGLFTLCLIFPAYITSWHRSLPRHILIGFPIFIGLALLLDRPWLRHFVMLLFGIFLIACTVLFTNAFWIA